VDERLDIPQGSFVLRRFPRRQSENLRAWDAADEYLLQHIAAEALAPRGCSVLVLNDSFGALSVALSDGRVQALSDSSLAHRGTRANLADNGRGDADVRLLSSLESPDPGVDLVLIKAPRNLSLLEDQLHRIRPLLVPATRIVGAGMVKAIHTSTLELFERLIGPTHTSLARKRARLVFASLAPDLEVGPSPYPLQYSPEDTPFEILNHANVFSHRSLDIGTRFFLEHIGSAREAGQVIDLGCGNGVVGLTAAARNEKAEVTFADESYMAVASAEANFRAAFGAGRPAHFRLGDCLEGCAPDSSDLVLCNPPFHHQRAVGDAIAWQMFGEARTVLRSGGELRVIGNRHLAYHAKLKHLFGHCAVVASSRKFVVLRATCP